LSIREATEYLEQIYSDYYVKPFVYINVTNKRVIVFPGNGGAAKVLYLTNNNTTVIEALALTGGIAEDGKAYKVKLIRNQDNVKPKVYLMDLSKIDGIAVGNTVVMAHDIIYVEPRYRFARTLVSEITPIVSLISSTFLLYTLVSRVK
jgi:polysaccharide export outer membrane protein